jgi:hypothetical protein
MMNELRDIEDRMNILAYQYAEKLRKTINQELSKPKIMASGNLKSSVRVTVQEAKGYQAPIIHIEYAEYGEFIGKRKLLWTKLPPVDEIKEWVLKRGIHQNGKIPGYTNGAPNLPDFKKAEQIAWAIAKNKRENDKFKRHAWKKASLPEILSEINNENGPLFREYTEHIEEVLSKAISNKK